jgi:hypothetical protein
LDGAVNGYSSNFLSKPLLFYLGLAEKVKFFKKYNCYKSGISFKKQAIENGRVKSASIAKEEY